MEPGGSMPHSQGLSNNSYPEPNQPNYPYWYLCLQVRINLPLFSTVFPSNSCCFCQQLFDGKTEENKGKLILTEIFPTVEKHDI